MRTTNAAAGEQLRDQGIARVASKHPVAARRIARAWVRLALDKLTVNADDVRAAVELPAGADPRLCGAAPLRLARLGILQHTQDFTRSMRPESHRRPIPWWSLGNRAAAVAFLRDNPEIPGDDDGGESDERRADSLFYNRRWGGAA